jgi:hypothetical protein
VESGTITRWRKSSFSGTSGDNCVESRSASGAVEVRDTKDRAGGALIFDTAAWHAFTAGLKSGC